MRYILTSDFFIDDFIGGAALNDEEIYKVFKKNGEDIEKIKTSEITEDFLNKEKESFFIVSNFFHLAPELREKLMKLKYIIYAHDYKFVQHTNPAAYDDFKVPESDIINKDFHEKAIAIMCQSSLQQNIYNLNLDVKDSTINVSGNLWSDEDFEVLEEVEKIKNKKQMCSVIKSHYWQKGVPEAIKICIEKKFNYDLIHDDNYHNFLRKLGANAALMFYPLTPETLCRAVVEARMMNVKVITSNMVGATHEKWFDEIKGKELIDYMKERRNYVYSRIKLSAS
tara:strand:+ start:3382 stop:4227 length:846 start_codon:yes stop_codon:yes gene_type:complete